LGWDDGVDGSGRAGCDRAAFIVPRPEEDDIVNMTIDCIEDEVLGSVHIRSVLLIRARYPGRLQHKSPTKAYLTD
jgi:hypothetical protein